MSELDMSDSKRRLRIRTLSYKLAKKAHEELNEIPTDIEKHVADLRHWIEQQPHLKARTDDQFLISFLRGCKYNQTLARQKIDLFFTMRTIFPEVTKMRDIRSGKIAKLLKLGTTIPLPLTNGDDGPRIFLICPGRANPKEYDLIDIFKLYVLLMDYLLISDDNLIVGGQIGILDLTNVTPEHFAQFKPDIVKKMTYLCQDSSPVRPKGFHYVNTPNGFELIFNMFKSFMSEEHKEQLYVHGFDLESLYQHIPRCFLPAEYGGEAGSIQNLIDYWEQKLLNNFDSLLDWEQYGSLEILRQNGAPITEESIIAMPDSRIFFS